MGRVVNKNICNPDILFKSLDILIDDGWLKSKDILINFYGTEKPIINDMVKAYKSKNFINLLERIPYDKVPEILKKSTINLILTENGRKGVLTTKLFEYMAVKRPILCIPEGSSELTKMIIDTNAGVVCDNVESIIEILRKWYSEWTSSGTVKCFSDTQKINKYSRKAQAGELAGLLSMVKRNYHTGRN